MAFVSRFHEKPRGLAWSVYKGHEVEMVWGWFFSQVATSDRKERRGKRRNGVVCLRVLSQKERRGVCLGGGFFRGRNFTVS